MTRATGPVARGAGRWPRHPIGVALAAAIGAYVVPQTDSLVSAFWANLGTLLGALCVLVAALLSRRVIDEKPAS